MPLFPFREEIEAAKTLLFGLSAGAGIGALGNASTKSSSSKPLHAAYQPAISRLNSKGAPSDSNSESEDDDLGFGDSEYFHDNKYGKATSKDSLRLETSHFVSELFH